MIKLSDNPERRYIPENERPRYFRVVCYAQISVPDPEYPGATVWRDMGDADEVLVREDRLLFMMAHGSHRDPAPHPGRKVRTLYRVVEMNVPSPYVRGEPDE